MNSPDQDAGQWQNAKIIFHPIGVIHSEHHEQESTPIQGVFNPCVGTVEVFTEFAEGLRDIESFTYVYLLYYFDRATGATLLQRPFLDGERERGIFAIRHYNRPNPIGISIVRLLEVNGTVLTVEGMDILDGTPLLDIKPYVRQFDHRNDAKSGWVDKQHLDDIAEWNSTPKELRKRDRTNT